MNKIYEILMFIINFPKIMKIKIENYRITLTLKKGIDIDEVRKIASRCRNILNYEIYINYI